MSTSYEDETEEVVEGLTVTTDLVLYEIPVPNEEEGEYCKWVSDHEAYVDDGYQGGASFASDQFGKHEAGRGVSGSLLHIQVLDHEHRLQDTVALLDTGCLYGNWVSTRKLRELKLERFVDKDAELPLMLAVNGEVVGSRGSIILMWKVTNVGTRFHSTAFFVFDADHIDIIFGAEFLFSSGVVQVVINRNVLAPFVKHYNPSPAEKLLIEAALEKQRLEKLERERRRQLRKQTTSQPSSTYETWPEPEPTHDEI